MVIPFTKPPLSFQFVLVSLPLLVILTTGKIELNETPEEALHREILEELDTNIEIISILEKVEHQYPDFSVHITFYECSILENQLLTKIDHHCLSWLSKGELHELDWADADIPIVELLQKEL